MGEGRPADPAGGARPNRNQPGPERVLRVRAHGLRYAATFSLTISSDDRRFEDAGLIEESTSPTALAQSEFIEVRADIAVLPGRTACRAVISMPGTA